MPSRIVIAGVFLGVLVLAAAGGPALAAAPDWKAVEQALGKTGQLQAGAAGRRGQPRPRHEADRAGARPSGAGDRRRRVPGHGGARGGDHRDGPPAPARDGHRDGDELPADGRGQGGHHRGLRAARQGGQPGRAHAPAARHRRDRAPQPRPSRFPPALLHALLGDRRRRQARAGLEGGARPDQQREIAVLDLVGYVDLPPHAGAGGFDHAAVHRRTRRVFVAHTANDAVDVIDAAAGRLVETIEGLPAVAGALVSDERDLVFTSNRGDNTVGVAAVAAPPAVARVAVGVRPNGLAYDARRHRLFVANVGDPAVPGSFTVSVVDVATMAMVADVPVPGRTRWAVYDPVADVCHVNIADPPLIVALDARDPVAARRRV